MSYTPSAILDRKLEHFAMTRDRQTNGRAAGGAGMQSRRGSKPIAFVRPQLADITESTSCTNNTESDASDILVTKAFVQ